MAKIVTRLAAIMAGSVVLVGLAMPASAIDIGDRSRGLGVSVDVGGPSGLDVDVGATVGDRRDGVNVDASADVGGGDALADVDATASVGGASGVNAEANVDVGRRDSLANVDATASIGGSQGIGADVDANIGGGGGTDARVRVGIGDNGGEARVVIGRPAPDVLDPRTPTNPPPAVPVPNVPTPGVNPAVPAAIANMSGDEVMRFQRRCRGILSDQAAYDRDLIALCRMLRMASR